MWERLRRESQKVELHLALMRPFEQVVHEVPEIRRKSLRRKSVVVVAYCCK